MLNKKSFNKSACLRCVICPSCDSTIEIHVAVDGMQQRCPICGTLLIPAHHVVPLNIAIVAVSSLLVLICSLFEPFITVSVAGISATFSLSDIVLVLYSNFGILLSFFLCFTVLFPNYLLIVICFVGFFRFVPGLITSRIYKFCHRFAMVDVFVLAVAVSLVKLLQLASVSFHIGFVLMLAYAFLFVWCWRSYRPIQVWDMYKSQGDVLVEPDSTAISQEFVVCRSCGYQYHMDQHVKKCPRCGQKYSFRKALWGQKTSALLISALIMFLPANLYPIMDTTYIGSTAGSNIVDGVISLWDMGSWFVAVVVVTASLFIPVFKILSLSYLAIKVKYCRVWHPRSLSTLYRITEFIGKWSMIDVFVVIIMSSTMRMGNIITINPGFAVIAFCLVVMVTMFAASSFDERLIWDNFRENVSHRQGLADENERS